MYIRDLSALISASVLAGGALAQGYEIVYDATPLSASVGPSFPAVGFSMYLDAQGVELLESGGEARPFMGWAGFEGVFNTAAGQFLEPTETDDDASGGEGFFFGSNFGIVQPTDWSGRRPGIVAVNGSGVFLPETNVIIPDYGTDGSRGSLRTFGPLDDTYEVRNGGLTLGFSGGRDINAEQRGTEFGGVGQATSGRIEVFRGLVLLEGNGIDSYIGLPSFDGLVSFDGSFSFFTDEQLQRNLAVMIDAAEIPAPGPVALGLASMCVFSRRRSASTRQLQN